MNRSLVQEQLFYFNQSDGQFYPTTSPQGIHTLNLSSPRVAEVSNCEHNYGSTSSAQPRQSNIGDEQRKSNNSFRSTSTPVRTEIIDSSGILCSSNGNETGDDYEITDSVIDLIDGESKKCKFGQGFLKDCSRKLNNLLFRSCTQRTNCNYSSSK